MTVKQTGEIMDALETAYPRYYAGIDRQRRTRAVVMWASAFEEDDPRLVAAAVRSFIEMDEKGFPPVPGQIKAKMRLITARGELSENDAWNMVRKAVRNSVYESRAEFERLPPRLRKLVGSPNQLREWSLMDSETLNSVVASNFLKAYRTQTAREREYNALSPDVRAIVAELAAAKAMPEIPERKPEASPLPDGGITKRPERIRDMAQALREGRTPDESGGKGGAHDGE